MEMMVEMKSPHGLTQTILHIVDTTSKSYIPSLLDAMWDVILQKLMEAAVGILCQTDPSHAELYKTFLTDPNIVIPRTSEAPEGGVCLNPGQPDADGDALTPDCLQALDDPPHRVRPLHAGAQLDANKLKSLVIIINPPLWLDVHLHAARVAPKGKVPDAVEQICTGPTSMAMEGRRGFSAKVLATLSDTNAKEDSFQSVHSVTDTRQRRWLLRGRRVRLPSVVHALAV